MNSSRQRWMIGAMALVMMSVASSSWAWRGGYGGGWHGGWGGGWRGGWYGPGVGLYLGGAYDPYYYPYGYGYPDDPYAYPNDQTEPGYMATASPNEEGDGQALQTQALGDRTLKGVERAVSALESQVNNDYDDGDISRSQRKERIKALKQIRDEARQEAKAYDGKLTPEQADVYLNRLYGRKPSSTTPSANPMTTTAPASSSSKVRTSSPRALNGISDLLLELRSLLDQKLKDGDITKGQAQSERRNLDQVEQEARQDANANGGNLSSDDESALTEQLHRAYYQINHNFVE